MKVLNVHDSWEFGLLCDWYINSVCIGDVGGAPVWTEEHLEELTNDFYVIPKNANAEMELNVCKDYATWVNKPLYEYVDGSDTPVKFADRFFCSNCGTEKPVNSSGKFCSECGRPMLK